MAEGDTNPEVQDPAANRDGPAPPAIEREADKSLIFPAVRRAFALGWNLVELRGKIESERGEVEQRGMRVASLWRVSLARIALIHAQVFPLIGTEKTFYAPQESLPKYLFPSPDGPDYTQFSLLDARDDKDVKLASFKLYDVTRRAINCLALLYVNPDDSLDSERIKGLQTSLVNALAQEAPDAKPKVQLTILVGKFLEAWDGFLREHYYAGGMLPNNDLELIAYEAGRSMALLSWQITNETLGWERSLPHLCGHKEVPQDNQDLLEERHTATVETARADGVKRAWERAFRPDFVIRLQHDVVALSSKLDDAYLAQKGTAATATQAEGTDPELPSVSIRAIKQGLEFWRRAVMKTLDAVPEAQKDLAKDEQAYVEEYAARYGWSASMRLALTKQVNIWQTLISGQQTLRAFSTESVAQKLVNEVWDEIQAGLAVDVRQAIQRAESAAATLAQDAGEAVESVFVAAKWFFIPLGIFVALVIIAALVVLVIPNLQVGGAAPGLGLAGAGAAIAASFKWLDFSRFKEKTKSDLNQKAANTTAPASTGDDQGSGIAERLSALSHSMTTDALTAIKTGFAQVQTELDDLNRSVSVAYPLVDYIALARSQANADSNTTSETRAGTKGGIFLKDIIWTSEERAEELKAVVRAAFGPVAVLAYSAAQHSKKDTGASDSQQ
ncbi:hypothetical protein GCT13_41695 [Paraburkholderia sp. CNPSo 3157]|uniref:Uncharacterized protein n=1 Tax=Paraburkholderia franconis TaxID=2654983 RepID=A0A7X1NKF9_9BURK|nr:hypothetical protein [Paraburkholderia franconis]MPW23116.1 hypothetical protein [Paraburkholderia franconis]